MHQYYTKT